MEIIIGDEAYKKMMSVRNSNPDLNNYYEYDNGETGTVVIRRKDRRCCFMRTSYGGDGGTVILTGTAKEFRILSACFDKFQIREMIECAEGVM